MAHLNYKEIGEGPPVIILHGLLGMLDNWRSFSKALAEGYRVISPDQRNHGRSFHSDEFNYTLLAEDLRIFLEELEIESAHFIGHSMGGKAVMEFLRLYPQRVNRSIIVDISPKGITGDHHAIFDALLSADITTAEKRSDIQDQLMEHGFGLGTVLFLMKNLSRNKEGAGFSWKANIQSLSNNYGHIKAEIPIVEPIHKNILFISGGKSNYIKEDDLESIADIFPYYAHFVIEDAGHWVHADQPELLLEVVQEFLTE